jgi:endonuclease YncB( thermonuclease family)
VVFKIVNIAGFLGRCRKAHGIFPSKAAGLAVATIILSTHAFVAAAPQEIVGRASVIDGDTLEIHGQRVRLHGIDAPESRQTCKRAGKDWRCGQAAALALSNWIGTATVTCQQTAVDRYKRIVARCSANGHDIAVHLVREGWALDWPRYSGGEYGPHQEAARTAGKGIWGSEFVPPWEWRAKS